MKNKEKGRNTYEDRLKSIRVRVVIEATLEIEGRGGRIGIGIGIGIGGRGDIVRRVVEGGIGG